MARENIVKFGEWISEGWDLFRQEWQTWALMGLVVLVGVLAAVAVIVLVALAIAVGAGHGEDPAATLAIVLIAFLMGIGIVFFIGYVQGGCFKAAFNQLEGKPIRWNDVWSAPELTLRMTGANLMIGLLTVIGALMCYLPAFVVAGLTYFTLPLIVRKNVGVFEALTQSKDLAKRDWLMFTLFAFVVSLIAQIGVYACYVGIIFSFPLTFTIGVVAYRDCFEPGLKPESKVEALYTKSCRQCGASIPVDAAFCDRCGAGQV